MIRKKIDTLVVDLDNTLFDWLALWHDSFSIMYREITALLGGVGADAAIRRIHQVRRTSEYRFLIDELLSHRPSDAARVRGRIERLLKQSDGRRGKEPYKGVRESLTAIKAAGTKVVACTESMEFYSVHRLRTLGLEDCIDELFCNKDYTSPLRQPNECAVDSAPSLKLTRIHYIAAGLAKPDPRILSQLLDATGSERKRAAYVGDSIARDVVMARRVGVTDIHASYGETNGRPEFELLSRVSHWTDEDVHRENAALEEARRFKPSITLRSNFAEIFDFIEFEEFGFPRYPGP
jgi:FMN phosphatase YigB (HAD superfamily)